MKIGMIGIGDIAQKAYLPVMTTKKDVDIVLCSRNEANLISLKKMYKGIEYVMDVKELINSGIKAALVHAATSAHYMVCKELLEHGIHVYVDKPVSYHIKEVRELYQLAKDKDLIFRVGFNRREAPMVKALKKLEKPSNIIYQKNRVNLPAEPREYIYDDFIHVVDSVRYLLGEDVLDYRVNYKMEEGLLYSVTLTLVGQHGIGIGMMNRESGKTEEKIEYICSGEKRTIEDLNNLTIYREGTEIKEKYGDWESVLYRRGFSQITDKFIKDVNEIGRFMEVDEDSLKTHELCEKIVASIR